jgi:hypothetical protein
MPRTGTQQASCIGGSKTEGIYDGFTYLTIGDLIYTVPTQIGRNLFGGLSNGCLSGNNMNPNCYPIDNLNLGTINTPIWLREGKQVIINNSSISITISAIEFNIVN